MEEIENIREKQNLEAEPDQRTTDGEPVLLMKMTILILTVIVWLVMFLRQ